MAGTKDVIMCSRFNKKFKEILDRKSGNNVYLSKEKYTQIVNELKVSKVKVKGKQPIEYRRQKRFDVMRVGGQEKLISPLSSTNAKNSSSGGDIGEVPLTSAANLRYFVCNDDLFKVIHETHLGIGHGGRNRMMKELKSKYTNVTSEAVMIYLNLCKQCHKKSKTAKEEIVVRPAIFSELDSRCLIDWIDMQTRPDGDYRYVLVCQDHPTRFVSLRPLRGKGAEEVCHALLDVFATLGAPNILQCDSDRDYAARLVQLLAQQWEELRMVHGKSAVTSTLERTNQEVEMMLSTWLQTNKSERWSVGLRYVQMIRNRAYHEDIEGTPFEAMFGREPKIGLRSSSVPDDVVVKLNSEEQLQSAIDEMDAESFGDVGVVGSKNVSGGDADDGSYRPQYSGEFWDQTATE